MAKPKHISHRVTENIEIEDIHICLAQGLGTRQLMRSIGRLGGQRVVKQARLVRHSLNPKRFLSERFSLHFSVSRASPPRRRSGREISSSCFRPPPN